ncbi:MAG TPA: phosphomannomutase/phosphoglucomutase [Calditrichia bacterium]|nr:phosphomannomutase/phosphoglucomutase [Calditrichota bacterium]HQU71257.1 phosphomannomutase/phosphoglucomutase [Calditrichia bacterium]HQV30748.1 phosphomannomutase/phosphoglucomutase [Calditrichia bacterium]
MAAINPFIFREYDIRGVVDQDLTEDTVALLGKGLGSYFAAHGVRTISVGGDVRLHTERLSKVLIQGLLSTGIDVINLGAVPTGVQYFSLYKLEVQGGVMITGSHNPPEFNGFKISLGTGPVYGEEIQNIRKIIEDNAFATGAGKVTEHDIIPTYMDDITGRLKLERPVKVVIDCGNGAASLVACELFKRLGADAEMLYCEPDGNFPNHHPDPTVMKYIKDLIAKVKNSDAELGIGFDGDGDRVGVVDQNGNVIFGDRVVLILAKEILKKYPGGKVVFDVKCSQALPDAIRAAGGEPVMWKTGHSLLKKKMAETNAPVGGEMSGHIFIRDNFYGFDDAVYVAARLLEMVSQGNMPISDFLKDVPDFYSTPEIRAECKSDAEKFRIVEDAIEYFKKNHEVIDVDGVRIQFGDGWGLVRASNTQPVIVMRFEARSQQRLEEIRDEVVGKLREFGEFEI